MRVDIDFDKSGADSYRVFIDELDRLSLDTKVAIITNPTVAKLHLQSFVESLHVERYDVITVPDGEQYKNMETLESILNQCFALRLDRKSVLIALGGGVIGDMTGFAASIYQRGIDFIQVPTTLLAQVDASVGGKTGVNNSYGKNLIGSFWQPRAVYCETRFLKTLPKREFSAGVAEIIKMAVTFDADFFDYLERNDLHVEENLRYAVARCVKIKAEVVAKDERESGVRAVLNYGHTFGHVIENETKYSHYLHGEAVAIGMVMANTLAVQLGSLSKEEAGRIVKLLQSYDLPTSYQIPSVTDFYDTFFLDKKSAKNQITFILPKGIGDFSIRKDISFESVARALGEFAC